MEPRPITMRALIGVCVRSFTLPSHEGPTPSIPYARRFREAFVICPGSHVYDQKMNPIDRTTAMSVLPLAYATTSVYVGALENPRVAPLSHDSAPMKLRPAERSITHTVSIAIATETTAANGIDHSWTLPGRLTSPPMYADD